MHAQEALPEVLLNKSKVIWQGKLRICLTRLGSFDNGLHEVLQKAFRQLKMFARINTVGHGIYGTMMMRSGYRMQSSTRWGVEGCKNAIDQ